MKETINDATIFIRPSNQLILYIINSLKEEEDDALPRAFVAIRSSTQMDPISDFKSHLEHHDLLLAEDYKFIETLDLHPTIMETDTSTIHLEEQNCLITLQDLLWLWNKLQENKTHEHPKPHLHELLKGSQIVLPENTDKPRSIALDKRCERLKAQQENREYKAMTKNVDNVRRPLPEDTIAYQIKQINKQLIAVVQFIISVLAGFAFGFLGIELLVGTLDFGFRLLLGVICSLIIALAELYFLAKKLNEDLQYEIGVDKKEAHSKLD